MCVVGTGTTVAIVTSDVGATAIPVGRVISISGFSQSIGDIEDNDLATTGHMKFCPGTLIDHSEMTITAAFMEDASAFPTLGAEADITITFPGPSVTLTTGGTLQGTGWIKAMEFNGAEYDQRLEATFTWRFSGRAGTYPPGGETHVAPVFAVPSS